MRLSIFVLSLLLVFLSAPLIADNKHLTVELRDMELVDAIQMTAKFLRMNVMLSPQVSGVVSLQMQHVIPALAFDFLLTTHGLAKWQKGDIVYVAPREELIKKKQQALKWQEVKEESLPLETKIWQIKYANATEIARLLQNDHTSFLSKRGSIRVDERTNILYIEDVASTIHKARQLIDQIDVPVKQIVIEARLISVDNDFERELGIDFNIKTKANVDKNSQNVIEQAAYHYSLAIAKLADGSLLDVKLAALENNGHAELISSPILLTANQQPAAIEAGEEIPYQEVSESGGTALVFKKAVLSLKVTPHALPKRMILLKLQINQDRPSNRMIQGVPTISTRKISTNVLAKEGQTIVLGGIYESNDENGQRRLPFISQVPIIGRLFQQINHRKVKRELLIFVTPKIMTY